MKRFIVLLLVCCLGAAVTARPIRGTVKCAGTPVSGVTVTDGHSFTESGADGTFTLDADDDALFISIVTPSGYLAPMEQDIPQFFRPYAASTKRYDFELRPWPATGRGLRIAGDRRPAAQNRGAFRPAPNRDHPRTATRDRPREATGHGTGGTAARRHRLGLSGAVRRRPRAVRIARNTGLRRDRQPRPRPEQIHRPGGHGELPEPFRPHLLRLRHGTDPLHRPRRHRLPRSEEIRRADRLAATGLGRGIRPAAARPGRASAWPCTPRP